MSKFGFSTNILDLIDECISTAQYSIVLNSSPFGYFSAGRGIRQGDPMSLALFLIFSDLLSRMLHRAEEEVRLSGVKVSHSSLRITHLMYTDDLVIYCKANEKEALEVTSILQEYCLHMGQENNWNKSAIHFSNNLSITTKRQLSRILGIQECSHRGKYLGHLFCQFRSKAYAYREVFEKISNKLSGWKQRALSMAGHFVLIKSVAQDVPSFVMQTIHFPRLQLQKWTGRCGISSGVFKSHKNNIFTRKHRMLFAYPKLQEVLV